MVIPALIRTQAGLKPGTELEVDLDGFSVRLSRAAPGPKIVRVGKRLVARPTVVPEDRPEIDVGELVRNERDRWPW